MHTTYFQRMVRTGLAVMVLGSTASLTNLRPAAAELSIDGSLTVNVAGLKNTAGQVCFSLFERSQGFPNDGDAVVAQQCVSAAVSEEMSEEVSSDETADLEQGAVTVTFDDLSLGSYAVSVLHDENEDQQINQGNFGIPTEGFGFSRNPVVQTGAPEFREAAIFVLGNTTADIEMIYF